MKCNIYGLLLATALLCVSQGCKKSSNTAPANSTTTSSSDLVVSSSGAKVLFTESITDDGDIHGYTTTQISPQDDGNVSWCYGQSQNYGHEPLMFRRKINVSTGDTMTPDGTFTKITDKSLYTNSTPWSTGIFYVQGTGKLYQSTKGQAKGDVPDYVNVNNTFNGTPRIYPNGDAFISSDPHPIATTLINYVAQMWVQRKHRALNEFFLTEQHAGTNENEWWHGGICFPTNDAGGVGGLTANLRSAYLIDINSSTQNNTVIVDSTPYSAYPLKDPVGMTIYYYSKASTGNTKMTIMSREYGNVVGVSYFTTYVVDNVLHKVKVVVNKAQLTDLYEGGHTVDFDLDGNIYYVKWNDKKDKSSATAIVKQTTTGSTTLKSDFLVAPASIGDIAISNTGRIFISVGGNTVVNDKKVVRMSLCTFN